MAENSIPNFDIHFCCKVSSGMSRRALRVGYTDHQYPIEAWNTGFSWQLAFWKFDLVRSKMSWGSASHKLVAQRQGKKMWWKVCPPQGRSGSRSPYKRTSHFCRFQAQHLLLVLRPGAQGPSKGHWCKEPAQWQSRTDSIVARARTSDLWSTLPKQTEM